MTISELQIWLDLNASQVDRKFWEDLTEYAIVSDFNNQHIFIDDETGKFYLFNGDGTLDDINKLTCIKNYMFLHMPLHTIKIPNNVKSIGAWAFHYCSSLMSATMQNSVTSIGYKAFFGCSGLKSVTIPNSVTSIGYYAFYGCDALKSLIFKGKTIDQVKKMWYYPWGIEDERIVNVA